jgi:hypothetical protein
LLKIAIPSNAGSGNNRCKFYMNDKPIASDVVKLNGDYPSVGRGHPRVRCYLPATGLSTQIAPPVPKLLHCPKSAT